MNVNFNSAFLNKDYETNKEKNIRGHSSLNHPVLKQELANGSKAITDFLSQTILAQAKFNRYKYLYNLSAEKCFNNTNNYSFSEAQECERQLISKDPVLLNLSKFNLHVETAFKETHEKAVYKVNSPDEYLRRHKETLLKMNFLYRYYYYFIAKSVFIDSCK